jgi:hypothetical protein
MIPAVEGALGELGLGLVLSSEGDGLVLSGSGGSEGGATANGIKKGKDKKLESRSGYWDDVCLARFLEGVCWRFVAYPVRLTFSWWRFCCSILADARPSCYRTLTQNLSLRKRSLAHQRTHAHTRSARSALSLSTDLTSS